MTNNFYKYAQEVPLPTEEQFKDLEPYIEGLSKEVKSNPVFLRYLKALLHYGSGYYSKNTLPKDYESYPGIARVAPTDYFKPRVNEGILSVVTPEFKKHLEEFKKVFGSVASTFNLSDPKHVNFLNDASKQVESRTTPFTPLKSEWYEVIKPQINNGIQKGVTDYIKNVIAAK